MLEVFQYIPVGPFILISVFGVILVLVACAPTEYVHRVSEALKKRYKL